MKKSHIREKEVYLNLTTIPTKPVVSRHSLLYDSAIKQLYKPGGVPRWTHRRATVRVSADQYIHAQISNDNNLTYSDVNFLMKWDISFYFINVFKIKT